MSTFSPRTADYIKIEQTINPCFPNLDYKSQTRVLGPSGLGVTKSGGPVPGYKRLIKNGMNAASDYTRVEKDIDIKVGLTTAQAQCWDPPRPKGTVTRTFLGMYLPLPSVPGLQTTVAADNAAKMSFISDVKRGYNTISGGVFLGELRETLNMIRHPARGFRLGLQDWLTTVQKRQSRYCIARNRSRWRSTCIDKMNADLASLWLEYSYGWSPLISDTIAGAEALNELINGKTRYTSVSGAGRSEESTVVAINGNYPGISGATIVGQNRTIKRSAVYIKGRVIAQANGPTLTNARDLFGFKLEEFVPTVWNLLPYSFLSDYFVNIGDILEATFFDRSSIQWAYKSTVQESYSNVTGYPVFDPEQGWSGGGSPGSAKAVHKSFKREASIDSLVPVFEISLPGGSTKWINMAALLASATKLQNRMSTPL